MNLEDIHLRKVEMENCLIILFGITGDLSKKRIVPAIYELLKDKDIKNCRILGIARRNITTGEILNESKSYIKNFEKDSFDELKKNFNYFSLYFNDTKRYEDLVTFIKEIEEKYNIKNRVFYLSVSPEFYEPIISNIKKYGLNKNKGFNRIILEKPFGNNLASAKKLNTVLRNVFSENEIFRIDHYLGKDIVQDIITLRFTNKILKSIWNKDNISHIQIISTENYGIEGRGEYYDKFGAVKDFVQSHVVQLLALTTVDAPEKLSGEYLRNHKIKILKNIKIEEVVLGQYERYKNESKVDRNSKTETLAALKIFVNMKNWKGIPIYVIHGKQLKDKLTTIYVEFKHSECLMLDKKCYYEPNYLNLQIFPNEGFYLRLNSRNPFNDDIISVKMSYCHECIFPGGSDAYKKLLKEVMKGNPLLFIRSDEVLEQWRIVEQIKKKTSHLQIYKKGKLPEKAFNLIKKDGLDWHLEIDDPNIFIPAEK